MAKKRPPPTEARDDLMISGHHKDRVENYTRALFRGFLRYVQRPGSTFREIWETERISDDEENSPYIKDVISATSFSKAASNGGWRKRREDHWRSVREKVLEHMMSEAIKSEIGEIEQLEALKQVALQHIQGDNTMGIAPVRPRSLEGAVNAFINLDKRVSNKRGMIAEKTSEAATTGEDAPSQKGLSAPNSFALPDVGLNEDEIAAMARAITSERTGLVKESPLNLTSGVDEDDSKGEKHEDVVETRSGVSAGRESEPEVTIEEAS